METLTEVSHDSQSRQTSLYFPNNNPGQTRSAVKCHPRTNEVCLELDRFFLEHWAFKNAQAKEKFERSKTTLWACFCYPLSADDRIFDVVKLNTFLWLLDDIAEAMDVAEGKEFYERLIPIAKGKALPNRDDPLEWITFDCFAMMRARDETLTEDVLNMAILCLTSQVDEERLNCTSLNALLKHRMKKAGCGFVAALARYGMGVQLSREELQSVANIEGSYGKHGVIVNDICSYDKEVKAWTTNLKDCARLVNVVEHIALNAQISPAAAKRISWILCREVELEHQELVATRLKMTDPPCNDGLLRYIKGLDYVMGGNEVWSLTTERYQERKL